MYVFLFSKLLEDLKPEIVFLSLGERSFNNIL